MSVAGGSVVYMVASWRGRGLRSTWCHVGGGGVGVYLAATEGG
jgi:hypothetical protein